MITDLGTVTLRSGETMRMECIQPPDATRRDELAALYAHKGERWYPDVLRRLDGKIVDTSLDYFFVGKIGDEICGGMWTTTPCDTRDVGLLGHVFTPDKHRKKGICDFLMKPMMERFKREGGLVMFLGTGNPVARYIYEKHGFRVHNPPQPEKADIFQWVVSGEKNFEDNYYAKSEPQPGKSDSLRVRPVVWGDLPRLEALYNVPNHPWLVRDESLGVYRDVGYERQFLPTMDAVEEKRGVCFVLENAKQRAVAVARLTIGYCEWSQHVATLEFFAHPFYFNDAPQLIRQTLSKKLGASLVRATAASGDAARIEILQQSGFKESARLKQQFQTGNTMQDLIVFSL